MLSSRLSSHLQVFALMLFSIEWFALFPLLRMKILVGFQITPRSSMDGLLMAMQNCSSRASNVALTFGLAVLALVLLLPISLSISALYLFGILSLQFGIPFWLLDLQSLKK